MKFWNFAADENDEDRVELRISGDLIDNEDAFIYEWWGMPCASPNHFREELQQYEGKNIDVMVDSYGGSVYAGVGIYNALMDHRKKGGHVTTIGDTKVMSAATLVFMAGEERKITPGCIFMVHNPLTYASGYAADLRKSADTLDEVKTAILNIYCQGTGRNRDELSKLMDDETYMSAQKAVEEKFATEVASGGVQNSSPKLINFSREKFTDFAKNDLKETKKIMSRKGTTNMEKQEIKNVADLENQHGELVAEIRSQAVKEERERMTALDALDDGSTQVHAIIMHAKENGQTAEDVQFFVDTAKAAAPKTDETKAGQQYMNKIVQDNVNSGVESVKGGAIDNAAHDEAERKSFIDALNKQIGGHK